MSAEIYFFGVISPDNLGHHLYRPGGTWATEHSLPDDFPCSIAGLDQCFLPARQPQEQGRARLWRTRGWTIVSFWDRSGDSRPGSNATLIARGRLDLNEVLDRARISFPEIVARWKFPVRP